MKQKQSHRPGVTFQPDTYRALQRGIRQMVDCVRPTLGPVGGVVAIDHLHKTKEIPELIDHGGTIARRIIELPNRAQDMGAMLARDIICRQHEEVGDGSATVAVLFDAIFDAGIRYITAGGNVMRIRHHMEKALPPILSELDRMSFRIEGQQQLTQVAQSLSDDTEMATLLGEIFDIIGEHGQLDIRKGQGRGLKREYVEGVYYNTGVFSREMIEDRQEFKTEYQNPYVFLCDFEVEDPKDLFPLMKMAADNNISPLVIVLRRMTESAMAVILANQNIDKFKAIAVKLPGTNPEDRTAALQDISILTGATPLLKVAGHTFKSVTLQHLGRARRIWAKQHTFGIIGGRGNPRLLRKHLQILELGYRKAPDAETRNKIRERIGRLMGGSATLWVGGTTKAEIEMRKDLANRAAGSMRSVASDGVVVGGGIALMNCRSIMDCLSAEATDSDERAAYRILYEALAAPARTILKNAGYEPGEILAQLSTSDNPVSFDVVKGKIVDDMNTSILDSVYVQKMAVRHAVSTAAMALTIDTLVNHKKPEIVAR